MIWNSVLDLTEGYILIFFFNLLFPPLLKALAQSQEAPCGDVPGFALASLHHLGKHSVAYSLLQLRAELG